MNKYSVSVYYRPVKNDKKEIKTSLICKNIAKYRISVTVEKLTELIENDYVWCPATFIGNDKKQDELDSIQIFALDFDGDLSLHDALERAERYSIPVAMYYETMSSENYSRFRFVFICNQVVEDKDIAVLISNCLCTVYPEADQTSKDFSKLYFPGKNSVCNGDVMFSIYDLLISTMQYLEENNPANKARKLKQIANKSHIVLMNGNFYIQDNSVIYDSSAFFSCREKVENNTIDEFFKSDEIKEITIYNNMVLSDNSSDSNYKIFFSRFSNQINTGKRELKQKLSPCAGEVCQLINDFINGIRLSHSEWFGLMLNLIQLSGGKQLFMNILEKYSEQYGDIQRKFIQMECAIRGDYHASRCDSFCPYSENCNHESNMCYTLKTSGRRIVEIEDNVHYKSIDDMRDELCEKIKKSLILPGIRVIKAPAGAGKTYACLQAVKQSDKQCIMALPNARLMKEIEYKAKKMGVSCISYPVVEELLDKLPDGLSEEIRNAYTIGDETAVNFILRDSQNPYAMSYLNQISTAHKFRGQLVLTTHARLLNLKEDYLSTKYVIIDEDILPMIMQTKSVLRNEVIRLIYSLQNSEDYIDGRLINKLKSIVNVNQYEFISALSDDFISYNKSVLKNHTECCKSNLFQSLSAECFYHDSERDDILFIYEKQLPECNCIILSATADKEIYSKVFNDRLSEFYDMGYLKYKGDLIIHADHTYSHDCFNQNPELMKEICERHSDCAVISFKKYAKYGGIYLGAAQGLNYLQGQNIVVAGTFHRPDYVYKLWFMQILGCIPNDVMAKRRVQRNGFSFPFMTFKDSFLQAIQLYMIESEQEQAVGRARLVSYKCTVHLYSNFPLLQGQIYCNNLQKSMYKY
ncbi:MAG: hypothetical protein K2O29_07215 [Ruminococcus sp.]|nr:hypothetical protein [Ruminococcus sp.]